jgi:hypothetical protein
MSASLLTISKRRIREILKEEVTLHNLPIALKRIISKMPRPTKHGEIKTSQGSADGSIKFEIPGIPNGDAADNLVSFLSKRAGLMVDKERQDLFNLNPGIGLLAQLEGSEGIEVKETPSGFVVTGEFYDDAPDKINKPIEYPDRPTLEDPDPTNTPGQAAARAQEDEQMRRHTVAQRTGKKIADTVFRQRDQADTVFMTSYDPISDALEELQDEKDDNKWWDGMMDALVDSVEDVIAKPGPWHDVHVEDGRLIIKKAAEQIVQKLVVDDTDPLKTRKISMKDLDDRLEDKLGKSEPISSTLFGFKVDDTVTSPPVSESLDPLRRLIRQIINESRLSKDT